MWVGYWNYEALVVSLDSDLSALPFLVATRSSRQPKSQKA